jgi:hypothetical protein
LYCRRGEHRPGPVAEVGQQGGVRFVEDEADGVFVRYFNLCDRKEGRAGNGCKRRILATFDITFHRLGVERRTVVELDAWTQREVDASAIDDFPLLS